MSLRASIHACLKADTGVLALIPHGADIAHFPERAPQPAPSSYVVSNEITGIAQESHGIPDDAEDTMDETEIQFTCFAGTVSDASALRSAIRNALLNDDNGILSDAHIVVASPVTRFVSEDDVSLHGAQLDLTFFHNPNT